MSVNQAHATDSVTANREESQQAVTVATSYLHRLPAELRNRIYRYTGLQNRRIELGSFKEPALALAIPDLRDELHSIIFAENKLEVGIYSEYQVYNSPQTPSRVQTRGGKYGAGKLALEPSSWVWKAKPEIIVIDHICLDVQEMGGSGICRFFINVRIDKKGKRVVQATTRVLGNIEGTRQIRIMGDFARTRANEVAKRDGFVGFSLADIKHIAAAFVSVQAAEKKVRKKMTKAETLALLKWRFNAH